MLSVVARPCVPRPGAARSTMLASLLAIALAAGLAAAPGRAAGQAPAAPASAASGTAHPHDMSTMPGHDMSAHDKPAATSEHGSAHMKSALGPYPMTREGSGTSWQPDATPMAGMHISDGDWSLMAHGFVNAVYDRQTGPRGDDKTFTPSMLMLMGNRPRRPGNARPARHAFARSDQGQERLSAAVPDRRDRGRRHPSRRSPASARLLHGAGGFLQRAARQEGSAFVYVGLPGEPALGPPAFMHRFSGMRNPGGAADAITGSTRRTSPSASRRWA